MEELLTNPNTWFSVITAATAIVALFQTQKQTKLSNKHLLFDRRIKNYMAVSQLYGSCNRGLAELETVRGNINSNELDIEIMFLYFTSNQFLESISITIATPGGSETQKAFMCKLDEVEQLSQESFLIYPESIAEPISEFLKCYISLLIGLYKSSYTLKARTSDRPINEGMFISDIEKIPMFISKLMQELFDSYQKIEKKNICRKMQNITRL